jgi:hypothetical protein
MPFLKLNMDSLDNETKDNHGFKIGITLVLIALLIGSWATFEKVLSEKCKETGVSTNNSMTIIRVTISLIILAITIGIIYEFTMLVTTTDFKEQSNLLFGQVVKFYLFMIRDLLLIVPTLFIQRLLYRGDF